MLGVLVEQQAERDSRSCSSGGRVVCCSKRHTWKVDRAQLELHPTSTCCVSLSPAIP